MDDELNPEVAPGECLLAVIGIDAVFNASRLRITVDHRERAARLVKDMRREIRRFLERPILDGDHAPPEVRYKDALAAIVDPQAASDIAHRLAASTENDEEHAVFVAVASHAVAFLSGIVPRKSRETVFGPVPVDPPDSVVARFRWAHGIAERPMRIFELLQAGTLIRDEMRALQAMFPTMYAAVGAIVIQELARLKGERPRVTMPRAKELALMALLLVPPDQSLVDTIQALYGQPDQPTDKPLSSAPLKSGGDLSSNSDRIAFR